MKLKLFFLFCLFSTVSYSQRLSLAGSNFSFAKGNIDVEILTEIIQQKQDEVAQRAFRNIVVSNFKKLDGKKKSFATYSYIYNVLETVTHEKNKTIITRQVVNSLFEYSLVYGFTKEFAENYINNNKMINGLTGERLFQKLQERDTTTKDNFELKELGNSEWENFNVLLDMAYDIFLKDNSETSLHRKGLFKMFIDKPTLEQWYNRDNAYLGSKDDTSIMKIKEEMVIAYEEFKKRKSEDFPTDDITLIYKELEDTYFKQETITEKQYESVRKLLRHAIGILKTYSQNNVIANISDFLLDYTVIEYAPVGNDNGSISKSEKQTLRGILYIDAEGLISNLYDKFVASNKRSTVAKSFGFLIPQPFFVIGATYCVPFSSNNQLLENDGAMTDLKNLYYASEKIGVKFTIVDRKYTHSFQPGEEFKYYGKQIYWIEPQNEPIISKYEIFLYGSGLLYNIVDIKTQESFNYTLVGASLGITFFNGLILNTGAALPVNATEEMSKKYLYTFSFDIPIIEYITGLSKKRNGN